MALALLAPLRARRFVCKVWNEDLMDVVHGSFRKGQHVAVSGRLKARKYASRQGGDRMALDVSLRVVN